ncbi:hypothetical protein [Leifsonia sp. Root112D2]|nr:hypothetical protein [Leifsonia sp. Root112D2]
MTTSAACLPARPTKERSPLTTATTKAHFWVKALLDFEVTQ